MAGQPRVRIYGPGPAAVEPTILFVDTHRDDGTVAIDGRVPVNTGGGLMAFGHPVGATGVKQAVEIHRQMRGLCGDYQIPSPPTVGLAANMGGDDRTAVVTIYRSA